MKNRSYESTEKRRLMPTNKSDENKMPMQNTQRDKMKNSKNTQNDQNIKNQPASEDYYSY